MDPIGAIGLAASVEQLAALAATIFCTLYSYYEAVRDAPKHSEELRKEMGVVGDQLNSLVLMFDSSPTTTNVPQSLIECVVEFERTLKDMNERIKVCQTAGLRRLKWPFSKGENKDLLFKMERFKSIINTALNIQFA